MSTDARVADAAGLLLRWCLVGVALLPLAVTPTLLLYPYVTPKALVLHGLAALMLVALAVRWTAGRSAVSATDQTTRAFALVVLVSAIAGALGNHPERSLWDSVDRMLGTATIGCAFVVFVAARHVVRTETERLRWLAGAALVAVPVAVVAVLQARGVAVLGLQLEDRPTSTLGHPAYVGALGLFAAFSGALVVSAALSPALRTIGAVGAVAGLVSSVVSEARSALLALVIGVAAVFVMRALHGRRGGRERRTLQWAVSAGMLAAAVVVLLVKSPWAHDLPLIRRLAGATWESHTIATRLLVWDASVHAWLEHPILGWGTCCFEQAFDAHYAPGLLRFTLPETRFDDAHNIFLNTLTEQGAVGGLALLAFVVVVIRATWRGTTTSGARSWPAAIALGFVVAHFTDKLFVFEGIISWAHLALFLALAIPTREAGASQPLRSLRLRRWRAVPAAAAAIWLLTVSVVPQGLATWRVRRAMALLVAGDPAASGELDQAMQDAPQHAGELSRSYCAQAARALPRLARAAGAEPAHVMGRHAFERQRSAARDGVRDTMTRAALVMALPSLGSDPTVLAAMDTDLAAAQTRSPLRQEIAFASADVARRRGDAERAESLLTEARDRDPTLSEPWVRLIGLQVALGRRGHARRLAKRAREARVPFDTRQRALLDGWLR